MQENDFYPQLLRNQIAFINQINSNRVVKRQHYAHTSSKLNIDKTKKVSVQLFARSSRVQNVFARGVTSAKSRLLICEECAQSSIRPRRMHDIEVTVNIPSF